MMNIGSFIHRSSRAGWKALLHGRETVSKLPATNPALVLPELACDVIFVLDPVDLPPGECRVMTQVPPHYLGRTVHPEAKRHVPVAWIARILGVVVLIVAVSIPWGWVQLKGSLPQTEGKHRLAGLSASVTVDRDDLGVPVLRGTSRIDVIRALGFLHGQERFFQMDLLRRFPAGELAELFGERALESDRRMRIHRFRARAEAWLSSAPPEQIAALKAYTEGVNDGLASLSTQPFEYTVLFTEPKPWREEDSLLAVEAMYIDLQDEDGSRESSYGVLHDTMPEAMFAFLAPHGSEWDAPIDGSTVALPPIPSGEAFDLRREPSLTALRALEAPHEPVEIGSNNFAIAKGHTADGGAILASDMHLGISVPIIWYRASLEFPDRKGGMRRVTGVTLPGTPGVIAGSNGDVAWGFTNSYGDWEDLVVLDENPDGTYRTPAGPRAIRKVTETIAVKGGDPVSLQVEETIWGPVIDRDHQGRRRALRWVAQEPVAVNLTLLEMDEARTLEQAMDVLNRSGAPEQNALVVDRSGRIGWTIMGAIPRRIGTTDWRLPHSWSNGDFGWDGWLEPADYPRIIAPPEGRLWSANARVVGGEGLQKIGDGGYVLGARAAQIRDDLRRLDKARETDLLAIQLDDRAIFLDRWQKLMMRVLDADTVAPSPDRQELRALVAGWGGRASVDSAGYRMVRTWRSYVQQAVMSSLTARAERADERFRWNDLAQGETPLWLLVTERPEHLLDRKYEDWNELLVDAADQMIADLKKEGDLADRTWGERNTSRFRHPLAGALPILGRWLEYPRHQLPGDWDMPRAQSPHEGASQRMVVSPGRENRGIFHMPGGQSGNPLSPHFADGHDAWVKGEPTPFLPGRSVQRLELTP